MRPENVPSGLGVDLHAAVDQVDQRQQLRLGAHGAHGRAEVRLAVVREDHVLQQQALFLRQAEGLGALLHLLRAHDQMADQLTGERIIRDHAEP